MLKLVGISDASSIDSALEDPRIAFAFRVTHEMAFKNLKIHDFFFKTLSFCLHQPRVFKVNPTSFQGVSTWPVEALRGLDLAC